MFITSCHSLCCNRLMLQILWLRLLCLTSLNFLFELWLRRIIVFLVREGFVKKALLVDMNERIVRVGLNEEKQTGRGQKLAVLSKYNFLVAPILLNNFFTRICLFMQFTNLGKCWGEWFYYKVLYVLKIVH